MPVHEVNDSGADAMLREQILRTTLCSGLPDVCLSAKELQLRNEMQEAIVGDWRTEQILARCDQPGCVGGAQCREKRVARTKRLVARSMLGRKLTPPVESRCWKFGPPARSVLLMTAFHRLLPRAVPVRLRQARLPNDPSQNDQWKQLHGFRVRKTHEWVNSPACVADLHLSLQALLNTWLIMAWIMSRDSRPHPDLRHAEVFYGQEAALPPLAGPKSQFQVCKEFVCQAMSPVYKAQVQAAGLLDPAKEAAHWHAFFSFTPKCRELGIKDIWRCVLPAASRVNRKVLRSGIQAFPLYFAAWISDDANECDESQQALRCKRKCCCQRGLHEMRATFRTPSMINSAECKVVAQEVVEQCDFSMFDCQLFHKCNRSVLEETCGHPVGLSYLSLLHMAGCVSSLHERPMAALQGAKRPRGGPPKETCFVKQARMDGWNAYVRYSKPVCRREDMQDEIKSGRRMKRLAEQCDDIKKVPASRTTWDDLALLDKQVAVDHCAILRENRKEQAKRKKKAAQAPPDNDEQQCPRGLWDLGARELPMRLELHAEPAIDEIGLAALASNHGPSHGF